jgi:hypothetical protein
MHVPIPGEDEREALIERAVAADLALRLRLDRAGAPPRPTYGDIHRAALFGDAEARARVAASDEPWVRRTYARLLARGGVALFETLGAANTGAVPLRRAGGYAVEVRPSRTRPERCFLVVTCEAGAAPPVRLVVHADAEGRAPEPLELPAPEDGVIQLVLPSDHPVVAAIGDPGRSFHLA